MHAHYVQYCTKTNIQNLDIQELTSLDLVDGQPICMLCALWSLQVLGVGGLINKISTVDGGNKTLTILRYTVLYRGIRTPVSWRAHLTGAQSVHLGTLKIWLPCLVLYPTQPAK